MRPDAPHLQRNYGVALLASGRAEAGLRVLRRAATTSGSARAEAWLDVAQAAWSAGDRDEATAALAEAARRDPAAISRRPQAVAMRDTLQLETLRRELEVERPTGVELAARAAFHAAELTGAVVRRLKPGHWPLIAAVLLLFVAAVRLVPPYVRHQLLRDDIAQVARTPILSDGVLHERLAYVFEARDVRPPLHPGACVVATHPPLRRITCAYSVPVSIVPGVEHTLSFRVDTEQPFVLRED